MRICNNKLRHVLLIIFLLLALFSIFFEINYTKDFLNVTVENKNIRTPQVTYGKYSKQNQNVTEEKSNNHNALNLKFRDYYKKEMESVNMPCAAYHRQLMDIVQIYTAEKKLQTDRILSLMKQPSFLMVNRSANASNTCYTELSLSKFHPDLYGKAKNVLTGNKCTLNKPTKSIDDLLIYSPALMNTTLKNTNNFASSELLLFTTMYQSRYKQFVYVNVIFNWPSLNNHSKLHPVLYIADMDTVEKSGFLLYLAYLTGWTIIAVPNCLNSGFPLLHSMFKMSRTINPYANWYGYANADILFTPLLMENIRQVNSHNYEFTEGDKKHLTFITSKRHDVLIPKVNILNFKQIIELNLSVKPKRGFAIDLFIYHSSCLGVFDQMPPFAVGRRGFDQWLIYDVLHRDMGAVDITTTSPMIHIDLQGLKGKGNSLARKTDKYYNVKLPEVKSSHGWLKMIEHIRVTAKIADSLMKCFEKLSRKSCDIQFIDKHKKALNKKTH